MRIEAGYRIVVVTHVEVADIGLSGSLELVQKEKPEIGKVVAIGKPGKKGLPIDGLKVGDIIGYRKYGESTFMLKGEEHKFVSFDDLIGRFKK